MKHLESLSIVICIILLLFLVREQRNTQIELSTFKSSLDSLHARKDTLIREEKKIVEKIRTNEKHYIYVTDSVRLLPDSVLSESVHITLSRFSYLNK